MKELIKKLLKEYFINERLTNIDDDVDLIYHKYFEKNITQIIETGVITKQMFKRFIIDTSQLNSIECVEAHKLNPCKIYINYGNNYYDPKNNIISISVNLSAVDFVRNNFDGDILKASNYIEDKRKKISLINEFKEEKIKGSINHELVHWIDDTMHNKHLKKTLAKASELRSKDFKGVPFNTSKIEIQAQIHNIKQLYRKYSNIWNEISFEDMLSLSSPLTTIYNDLNYDFRKKWIKNLKIRMHREGLLGKKMYN